jgi:hypothetical protein
MYNRLRKQRIEYPNITDLQLYANYTDKYKVKYLIDDIEDLHIVNIYNTYNSISDICLNELPEQFVIKCNHWSGDVKIIYSHKEFIQKYEKLRSHFEDKLNNIYNKGLEPHYKYIKPILFTEQYLDKIQMEYKFECIWGIPVIILAVNVLLKKRYYYTTNWKRLNIVKQGDVFEVDKVERPNLLENMIEISKNYLINLIM